MLYLEPPKPHKKPSSPQLLTRQIFLISGPWFRNDFGDSNSGLHRSSTLQATKGLYWSCIWFHRVHSREVGILCLSRFRSTCLYLYQGSAFSETLNRTKGLMKFQHMSINA